MFNLDQNDILISWKEERPSVLSFEAFNDKAGTWAVVDVKFRRPLGERARFRRSDELFYTFEAEGLEGVQRYAEKRR